MVLGEAMKTRFFMEKAPGCAPHPQLARSVGSVAIHRPDL